MIKSELRKIYLTKQKSFSTDERNKLSKQIADNFFEHFTLANTKNLHIFLSIEKNSEVETKFIYEKIWQDFPQVHTFVPRVYDDKLQHLQFNENTQLSLNKWQIYEPVGYDFFDENLFDIAIVPLLCFDENGFRVGYGKGFYDKFLSQCRKDCLKIGVSFFEP
ncbi:MAG: 5-formyltetrahydrofolate cyclo-ligase, partial [Pyrinomonadaceae bacterium]|nr:5-formyltetrahydrofolate cyclo-ligase [Pyrinomonadaceae bacterium]